jgi:hypothetical protein
LRLVDCATASAAAPTYLQPWTFPDDSSPPAGCDRLGTLVDGGVGVTGNPVYQACVEAFFYTTGYSPEDTTTVSLGTGRFVPRATPTWIWPWLDWVLGQLLDSPGEQQTEITWRQFPEMVFYRIDTELQEDIGLDDVSGVNQLQGYGDRLAELIDWEAILAGTDTTFRIDKGTTAWEQYKKP